MPRTPDEIKKGLECCKEDECFGERENCPYTADPKLCVGVMCADALALIQQLETQNAELSGKIGQLEAERDAAVKDIRKLGDIGANICPICVNCNGREVLRKCSTCGYDVKNGNFEWRGAQKDG